MNKTDNNPVPRPKISVVMVDGSFRDRYDSIDFMARQDLPPENYELIWVEYYDRINPDLQKRIDVRPGFKAISLGHTGTYHSSYCFNRGITEARGELVVIPDADVIAEPGFLETVWRDHQQSDELACYYHRYNEPEDGHRNTVNLEHLRDVCELTNPANHGACLSVRRKWLTKINGYDMHPVFSTAFHANDKDVYTRLRNLGLLVRWHPTVKLYHPWHASTGVMNERYAPQRDEIARRGRTMATLPFQGLDAAHNLPVPASVEAVWQYERERQKPVSYRLIQKVRHRLWPATSGRRAA